MAAYRPDPLIFELGADFYDSVEPARFPKAFRVSSTAAGPRRSGSGPRRRGVGRAISAASSRCPTTSPQPLALRYHGHQFRVYNPDIGDGRGFLFAQLRDGEDRLLDLGTKGSGQTPYSRFGDGRLTLKGGVREVLATEMLEALGRRHLEDLLAVRDRRGARARRRALADPLGGADAPQPRPYPHRHLPAPRLLRRGATTSRQLTDYCLRHLYGEQSATIRRARLFDLVSAGDGAARRLLSSPRASSTACSTATISRHRRELRLRPVALHARLGRATSPPPISTMTAFIPSAASPRRSTGTSPSWPALCADRRGRRRCPSRSTSWRDRFEQALVAAMLRAPRHRGGETRRRPGARRR